ncbi:MAG: CotH kinase family protein [Kiritimatiellae bacterium]|nr:CotH kinase family protein [Kiritimatiellia bacterium]
MRAGFSSVVALSVVLAVRCAAGALALNGGYDVTRALPLDAVGEGPITQIDISACPAQLLDNLPPRVEGVAALMPGRDRYGRPVFYGWGDARWNALSTPGAAPAEGAWFAARIETRKTGGETFVSYLVKTNAADYARLSDRDGRCWFRGGASAATNAVSTLVVAGKGEVEDWAGRTQSAPEPTLFRWVGGDAGDWNSISNWVAEATGAAATRAPALVGDVASVPGRVTLTREGVTATVKDFAVAFTADGAQVVGGEVCRGGVTLDVGCPQLGVPLAVEVPMFFGVQPHLDFSWWREGRNARANELVSVAAAYAPTAGDCEHWLLFTACDDRGELCRRRFYFSTLPVLYLDTYDGAPSSDKEEHQGRVSIQGNAAWPALDAGETIVKVRGNTTADYPKKPYKLKLAKKANLFGMGKNKHWVLLANYNDMSHLRNKLAADFANAIGFLGMDSTWVQCILNGEFIGTYQLSEHVRPGEKRVPVFDWEDELEDQTDLSHINPATADISGGYLFEFTEEYDELTRFTTTAGLLQMRTMVTKPEYLYTNPTMLAYCQEFLQNYWDACVAKDRRSKEGRHYSDYCEVGSMVDYFLVNELFSNTDSCKHSRFAYLDRGRRLVWGPVWDFDCSSGYFNSGTTTPEVWSCAGTLRGDLSKKYSMMKEWASDYYFCQLLQARYWEIRTAWGELFRDGGTIDQAAAELAVPCAANDARWPRTRTHGEDVAILKAFLTARAVWLDRQFATVTGLVESLRNSIQTHPSEWNPAATSRAAGEVPAVPLMWVRDQIIGKDTAYLSATASQLSAAVTAVPTVWGKSTPLWQDFIAGTNPDPASPDSVLRITAIAVTNDLPRLEWSPDLGAARRYIVEGSEKLASPHWHTPPTPSDRFFRVRVELP